MPDPRITISLKATPEEIELVKLLKQKLGLAYSAQLRMGLRLLAAQQGVRIGASA